MKRIFNLKTVTFLIGGLLICVIAFWAQAQAKKKPTPTPTPEKKFTADDAVTIEENGKRLKPKPGFELVVNGNTVTARKKGSATMIPLPDCGCNQGKSGTCTKRDDGDSKICGGNNCTCVWTPK